MNDWTEEEKAAFLVKENASHIDWIKKARPMNHWTAPYVTNHRYYARWEWGLDFETMGLQIVPDAWEQSDKSVYFVAPHYETRVAIDLETNGGGLHANNTLLELPEADYVLGSNVVKNDTDTREMHFAVNGRDGSS